MSGEASVASSSKCDGEPIERSSPGGSTLSVGELVERILTGD